MMLVRTLSQAASESVKTTNTTREILHADKRKHAPRYTNTERGGHQPKKISVSKTRRKQNRNEVENEERERQSKIQNNKKGKEIRGGREVVKRSEKRFERVVRRARAHTRYSFIQ